MVQQTSCPARRCLGRTLGSALLLGLVGLGNCLARDTVPGTAVGGRTEAPPPGGFEVRLDRNTLSVSYAGIDIIAGGQFYFDKPGWGELHKANPMRAKESRKGPLRRAHLQANADGIASYDLELSWTRDRLDIQFDYEVVPDGNVGFAVADLFLNKELFIDVPRSGLAGKTAGEFNAFGPVREIAFETVVGKVTWSFSSRRTDPSGAAQPSSWVLRDARTQKWRPARLRTFSFLNALKRPPGVRARQTLRATVEVKPRPNLVHIIEARGMLKAFDRLAGSSPALKAELEADGGAAVLLGRLRDITGSSVHGPEAPGKVLAEGEALLTALIRKYPLDRHSSTKRPVVVPEPQEMSVLPGRFVIDTETVIVLPSKASAMEMRGPTVLREELRDYFGVDVPIMKRDSVPAGKRGIVVGVAGKGALPKQPSGDPALRVTPTDPGPEGYALTVRPDGIAVLGSDERGAFYGVQTLIQLLRRDGPMRTVGVPCVTVRDWPEFKIRGMMIIPTVRLDLDYFKRTIRRVLARHKLNTVIIGEASMGFIRWDSHPEIARDGACTPDQLRECAQFAREHFLEVIPLVQSWGHCQYIFPKRPDLAESPDGKGSALCLSRPAVKEFLTDIYAEAIDIFRPETFHIGGDEAKPVAKCDRCKGTAPAKLVADHVTFLHNWLAKRNIKTMMWHDMLIEHGKWPGMSPANSGNPTYGGAITHPAAKMLPKDITMAVWIYGNYQSYPPIKYLMDMGFPVVACPWFDEKNNFSLATAARSAGAAGFIGTSWMYTTHRNLNMMSLLSMEYAWTPGAPSLDELPYIPRSRLQQAMLPALPSMIASTKTPINLASRCNRALKDDVAGDGRGWLDRGPLADLRLLPKGQLEYAGIPFRISAGNDGKVQRCIAVAGRDTEIGLPAEVTNIKVGRKARSLVFLHTSSYVKGARGFAEYVVRFRDGKKEHVQLSELYNISPAIRPTNFSRWYQKPRYLGYNTASRRAWVGMNLAGDEIDLQAFEWVSPRPGAEIDTVELRVLNHSRKAVVFLVALTAVE
ncbi:MAG: family 20 glycosylhydrolase [Kiritimatiellaeota bacterium]|nr:family 20 glycosylhydrolase [Kiritimatiellota bacterium]